jgi:DNA-damage-inducible protein J
VSSSTMIHVRVDPETKSKAKGILDELNISLSEAFKLYLKQIILHKGIPFEVKIPTALTDRTLRKSEAGQGLHKVSGVDELFQELND